MTTAVIGASGSLGGDIVRRIAAREPVLAGYHSNAAAAEALCGELQARGYRVEARQVDIRSGPAVESFLAAADAMGDPLRAVVSAEGSRFPVVEVAQADSGDMLDMLKTDVIGSLNILKAAHAILKRNGGGAVVLSNTTAVLTTLEYDAMSSVPKNAVAMLIRQAAREMGADNIRVNGFAPGVIDTGKVSDLDSLPPLVKAMVENCLSGTPLRRLGTTGEVAALCEFLTSRDAGYISGQIIAVDGGFSA